MATIRPLLRREGSTPAPPRQPPPEAPPVDENTAMDSLNLGQLQKILLPVQPDMKMYGYVYGDTRSFPEELEEWFQYTEEDATLILRSRDSFEERWNSSSDGHNWLETDSTLRNRFLKSLVAGLDLAQDRSGNIGALLYAILGAWHDTAGGIECDARDGSNRDYKRSESQIQEMQKTSAALCNIGAVPKLYSLMTKLCEALNAGTDHDTSMLGDLNGILTLLYVLVEVARAELGTGLDGSMWQVLGMYTRGKWVTSDHLMIVFLSKFKAKSSTILYHSPCWASME